ncbi:hypothetical protein FRC01_003503 [Tulasnella sp. 417]|nr:hypothetical protein FRC01_003503 [Tulasnella sp. 417]
MAPERQKAGLFSGVNTAFISLSMPTLSPNPAIETNALLRLLISGADNKTLAGIFEQAEPFRPQRVSIAMNCLFYASLGCSLIASIGAMMCKEWLHSWDRSGQAGSVEEQGRLRQRKFEGAQRWQLETIIDFLPTVVLISILLFFTGVTIFLVSLNTTVAVFLLPFGGPWVVLGVGSIFAGAIFPLCPYKTAASRIMRRFGHMLLGCWTRLRGVDPTVAGTKLLKGISQLVPSLYIWCKIALESLLLAPEFESTPPVQSHPNSTSTPDRNNQEAKEHYEQQVTAFRAALWLLEMAPRRDDQLIAVRFLCTTARDACAAVNISSQQRELILSLTLEAFDSWHSQPNERTQATAEHFGRALYHILPHTPESTECWTELTAPTHNRQFSLGYRFLRELSPFERSPNYPDAVGEEYAFQSALLRTLILTRDIPIETYRWTNLKLIIRKQDESAQLLGLWAKLAYQRFGHPDTHHPRQFPSTSVAVARKSTDSEKRYVDNDDFPRALTCGVNALKGVERQATPDTMISMVLDAVEIYTACVQKTRHVVETGGLLPELQELVADAIMGMMTHFMKSTFLNPPKRQLINFIISALRLLRSIHVSGYTPNLDHAGFDGLWYALDSIISAINSSPGTDRRSMDDVVIQILESISDWLPVKSGVYSPMVALEGHPQIIGYITWHLASESQKAEGRVTHLIYKNRFRWFTQASSALQTAWIDAGLSSHLVNALKRPDTWSDAALIVQVLEDITDMSMNWCRRLVAEGFLESVADVILSFDQPGDLGRRSCIQYRLIRALLSVWRHCSNIREINWPTEKMLLVIDTAGSATECLLERPAAQVDLEAQAFQDATLDKDRVIYIRNSLKLFREWANERLPKAAPITGNTVQAGRALLLRRTDGDYCPASLSKAL